MEEQPGHVGLAPTPVVVSAPHERATLAVMAAPVTSALAFPELSPAIRGQAIQVLQQARFDAVPVRDGRQAQAKRVAFTLGLGGMS